jgi:trk system potassium uptake protein TrkA
MKVVILGCSRVGALLASSLASQGNEVAIIDWEENSFQRLEKNFSGKTILGSGTDAESLIRGGIEKAEAFIAVTSKDNINLMAAQIVREKFKVPKILVRVSDPKRAQAFKELGLDIICPTVLAAKELEKFLTKK